MNIICHRRNTLNELKKTPAQYGIEVDIRSFGNKLTVHHDPFIEGACFEDWLDHYQHQTLILNVKEEGLESCLLDLMQQAKIEDFFFLDQSFPFLVKTAKAGENRCAIRISEFESIETVKSLAGRVKWVWVDCFTHFPLSYKDFQQLKQLGFSLCLVSPELQGRSANEEIPAMRSLLTERQIVADAVCTKHPSLWE